MKLQHFQLEQIKEYIDSQDIWYDDVKTEILDHVATAVEEKMEGKELPFIEACGEVFLALKINRFQIHKLKYEYLTTLRDVGNEMLTFLKGRRLFYLIAIISTIGLGFSISPAVTEILWALGLGLPIFSSVYFLAILNYPRKHLIRYQSYYVSRVSAVGMLTTSGFTVFLCFERWFFNNPIFAIIGFSTYCLYGISGFIIMNRTLKQVKSDVAIN